MSDDLPDLEPIDLAAEPTRETPTDTTVAMPAPPAPDAVWPAGWYSDPWTAGQYRYWTGQTWTGETNRWGPTNAGLGADPWPPLSAPVTTGYGLPTAPAPTEAPKPSRRGPIVAAVVALILLLVVSATVGYLIDANSRSDDKAGAPSTTTPGGTSRPGTTTPANNVPSTDPDRDVLGGLVVQQADVGAKRTVLLIPNGNFTSQPTLDLCNGTFPSERLRTARLQVAAVDAAGVSSLSTEAVLYRNPAASAQAFAELAEVRKSCPDQPVPSKVAGDPAAKTTFKAAPDTKWPRTPTVERVAYSFVSESAGKSYRSIAVYLRRGRALMGVYFLEPKAVEPSVAGERSIAGIVSVFEARMAQLPAAVVNRG